MIAGTGLGLSIDVGGTLGSMKPVAPEASAKDIENYGAISDVESQHEEIEKTEELI